MGQIELITIINAPMEICFDLSRSIDLHVESAKQTKERAVAGKISGLMGMNDVVTWEAVHFLIKHRLTVKITECNRPHHFQDCQVKGIFHSFSHDHFFEVADGLTKMRDVFKFRCPFGPLGNLVDSFVKSHLEKFLLERNQIIKRVAESGDCERYTVG